MDSGNRVPTVIATIIITCAIFLALVYKGTVSGSTYRTMVAIAEGGVGIALSYLLVSLYRQQREIQESQLFIDKKTHVPDIQCDLTSAELDRDDGRVKVVASNYGGGSAKHLRLGLEIDIPTTPETTSFTWIPESGGQKHNGENYISGESTTVPFWANVTNRGQISHSPYNVLNRFIRRKTHSGDEMSILFRWYLEYHDQFGDQNRVLAARTHGITVISGYNFENQVKAQLRYSEWFGIQEKGMKTIHSELLAAGLNE
jgi:hypothetical protein